jgi:acyl carrier protein
MFDEAAFHSRFDEVLGRHLRLAAGAGAGQGYVAMDDDLAASGLDSSGVINLLLDIEDTFGISLPEALLTPETFRTRATLERVVATLARAA